MVKSYTFDMTLNAAFTVEAESEEEARRILGPIFDCAFARPMKVTESDGFTDGMSDELVGEVSLATDPVLAQIDGKDV